MNVETLSDEKIAELLQQMELLSLEELTVIEEKVGTDKASLEEQVKVKNEWAKLIKAKITKLQKPMKDALNAEKTKIRNEDNKAKTHGEREAVLNLVVVTYRGNRYNITLRAKNGIGRIRQALVEALGVKKDTKYNLSCRGINLSAFDPTKTLRKVGIRDGDEITATDINTPSVAADAPTIALTPPSTEAAVDIDDVIEDSDSDDEDAMEDDYWADVVSYPRHPEVIPV